MSDFEKLQLIMSIIQTVISVISGIVTVWAALKKN